MVFWARWKHTVVILDLFLLWWAEIEEINYFILSIKWKFFLKKAKTATVREEESIILNLLWVFLQINWVRVKSGEWILDFLKWLDKWLKINAHPTSLCFSCPPVPEKIHYCMFENKKSESSTACSSFVEVKISCERLPWYPFLLLAVCFVLSWSLEFHEPVDCLHYDTLNKWAHGSCDHECFSHVSRIFFWYGLLF